MAHFNARTVSGATLSFQVKLYCNIQGETGSLAPSRNLGRPTTASVSLYPRLDHPSRHHHRIMLAVEQPGQVPDPLSIPSNAPEHCPVKFSTVCNMLHSNSCSGHRIRARRQSGCMQRLSKPTDLRHQYTEGTRSCAAVHPRAHPFRETQDHRPLWKGRCRQVHFHCSAWVGVCRR